MNQCWDIVNLNFRNKHKWNLKQNSCIFIKENAFESIVCEMAAIFSQPQCVNTFAMNTIGFMWFVVLGAIPLTIFIRPTQVSHIMVWRVSSFRLSIRPSVNIWLCTGVTTCRISFNLSDIIHLVCPIHYIGNGPWSSSNMRILTQLLIFAFWSFLKPLEKW